MTSGIKHDNVIKILTIPIGVLIALIFKAHIGFLFGTSFLLTGLWLSPDLDTISRPLKRWGILQVFWWPYRKMIPHRSFFSHGPLIGTSIRFLYITGIVSLLTLLISKFTSINFSLDIKTVKSLINQYPKETIALLCGAEASALTHMFQDMFPMAK